MLLRSIFIRQIEITSINATGSQRGRCSQPRFIEVANLREQPPRNQEARLATSAKRVPNDVPTAEVGQRTTLSGLDRPQQVRQPLSWRAQSKGLQIPIRALAS